MTTEIKDKRYKVFYNMGGGEPHLESILYHGDDLEAAGRAYLAGDHSGPLEIWDSVDKRFINPESVDCVVDAYHEWWWKNASLKMKIKHVWMNLPPRTWWRRRHGASS